MAGPPAPGGRLAACRLPARSEDSIISAHCPVAEFVSDAVDPNIAIPLASVRWRVKKLEAKCAVLRLYDVVEFPVDGRIRNIKFNFLLVYQWKCPIDPQNVLCLE